VGAAVEIPEGDAGKALLGLVIALVEILQDLLKLQAVRRMGAGSLSAAEVERVGAALLAGEQAVAALKREQGLQDAVDAVHRQLDEVAERLLSVGLEGDGPG